MALYGRSLTCIICETFSLVRPGGMPLALAFPGGAGVATLGEAILSRGYRDCALSLLLSDAFGVV